MASLSQNRQTGRNPDIETRLDAVLERLYGYYSKSIDLNLDRVLRFLNRLSDPHLTLPPVVHVAGTNGKGSTIATLRALLEASGKTVHVMTSPHLVHATERIRLAGDLISSQDLLDLLEYCLEINGDDPITPFEIFTAATFLAFSRVPADYALLETGMGGRLDATNVVPNPVLTVITTISKDHREFLGETLPEIAAEKAGIIKPGVPCIIGAQTPEALDAGVMDVFHTLSTNLSPPAPLLIFGADWRSEPEADQMRFCFEDESILLQRPNLLGTHQILNAGAALAAYRVITNESLNADILSPALGQIDWPGRLQRIETAALTESLPDGWELWCDGGHNDSAGQVLAAQAQEWRKTDSKPLHLIVAMVNRKDPAEFLLPLVPYTESITVTAIPGEPSSYTADQLAELVKPLGFKKVLQAENVEEALKTLVHDTSQLPGRLLITGSLYFIGYNLQKIQE